jgi:hypothetical protein
MARMYKDVDCEVEIEFGDVIEYINDYATTKQINQIRKEIGEIIEEESNSRSNALEGSYSRSEKATLLNLAAKKYTLEELEQRLGNKFDLI